MSPFRKCAKRFRRSKAPNFQKLRERYFAFRSVFFDPQKFSAEANLVIGRCISELASLIDIEQTYPDAAQCADPFDFFVRVLDSKEYLAQSQGGGVNEIGRAHV